MRVLAFGPSWFVPPAAHDPAERPLPSVILALSWLLGSIVGVTIPP